MPTLPLTVAVELLTAAIVPTLSSRGPMSRRPHGGDFGEGYVLGWKVRVRCAFGKRAGMKSIRECTQNAYLDLLTLLWTRGRDFHLAILGDRLKCPPEGASSSVNKRNRVRARPHRSITAEHRG